MIKWEYMSVYIPVGEDTKVLNDWGNYGWELSTINHTTRVAYFKRQIVVH